ncbi:hypothetical protein ACFFRR_007419 [Megaselia abdita]
MAETDTYPQTFDETDDEFELENSFEHGPEQIYGKFLKLASMASTTYIGQFVLEKIDKVLNIIETTGKWSLPQIPEGEKGHQPPLERPLPWIPFLLLIVSLRSLRIALSLFALMIGNNPISATDMVYFVQIRRRKLRSFRYQGIRAIKQNQQNQKQTPNQGVLSRVLAIFGSLICRPGIVENTYVRIAKPSRISEEKDYQPRKPAISSSDEGVDETVKKILEVYSKVINREEPGSPPPVVQSKSLLNEDKGAEEVTEIQNGDQHTPIEEPKVEPENDPTPPPEVEVTSKQQDQPEVNKKGVESGTEAARENHQTVAGTPEHEFDFDEFLMKKNSTNNKIDDIQSDKNNSNTNVQNGTVHNNHRGHKSSKKHSARMNGRIGTGSHH